DLDAAQDAVDAEDGRAPRVDAGGPAGGPGLAQDEDAPAGRDDAGLDVVRAPPDLRDPARRAGGRRPLDERGPPRIEGAAAVEGGRDLALGRHDGAADEERVGHAWPVLVPDEAVGDSGPLEPRRRPGRRLPPWDEHERDPQQGEER